MNSIVIRTCGRCLAAVTGLALLVGVSSAPKAESDEEKGYAIARANDESGQGFADSVVELQMVLRNKAGEESVRDLEMRTLEIEEEDLGDRSLIIFRKPRDIKGTALLSHAKILDADDQWIFLPALKRTKRIASRNKAGPFVGSEFAFEDFVSAELEKFGYKYLRTEPCGGLTCDVVERVPRDKYSGYSRQEAWFDQTDLQIRRIDYFDRRGDLMKTLSYEDYRLHEDKFWRAHRLLMVNHQTGKSTDLLSDDYQFSVGLSENDFVKGALTKIR